jgi:uncharacterized damage-inducible protein DinB
MYQTIASFLTDWKVERAATLKVLRALTDGSLSQKVDPAGRSLGFLAWHIVLTIGEMGGKAGVAVAAPPEDEEEPTTAASIAAAFDAASLSMEKQLPKSWTDAMLDEEITMYGQPWKRSAVLSSLILHQAHHRGQMTVLMRQAGLQVPGVYGPAREEWAQMGMPPMK